MNAQAFDFSDLFVFEMANNHQGDVRHGIAIIEAMARLMGKHEIKAAIKFQFRHLDSFVHPAHRAGSANKHVSRFLSTALTEAQFAEMAEAARSAGLLVMTTPFDESSIGMGLRLGVDILKVASCSGTDYPLLREMARAGKPVLASNGGLAPLETGRLVDVFEREGVPFALQHCVAKYPTEPHDLQLGEITRLKKWFPHLIIGFSTHERPTATDVIKMAYAKGARTFEKHVGLPTDRITLNVYSADPGQVDAWLSAWAMAKAAEGGSMRIVDDAERKALAELKRGVFARRAIVAGEPVQQDDVYFAFPYCEGGVTSGDFVPGRRAVADIPSDGAVVMNVHEPSHEEMLAQARVQARMLLNEAGAVLPRNVVWEFSHHYGMEEYAKTGLTMIEIINREYCHKLLVVFPGQGNPHHYHMLKEETFRVIWGELHIECGGMMRVLYPGDLMTVEREVEHQFSSPSGCVFEEISTTQLPDDSFYRDPRISERPRESRKSRITA
jgi:N-acetylneuraminate synthase